MNQPTPASPPQVFDLFKGAVEPRLQRLKGTFGPSFGYKIRESMQRRYYLRRVFKKEVCGFELDDKIAANEFSRTLGVPTADILNNPCSISKILFDEPGEFVLKPRNSANSWGVQFVKVASNLSLSDCLSGNPLTLRNIHRQARRDMAKKNFANSWLIEKMVAPAIPELQRPDDLKLYCFYGRVALALHKRISNNQATFLWYDADGRTVDCGKYSDRPIAGGVIPTSFGEAVIWASQLSANISLPFVRLDFLISSDGPVFGELTPHPGGFDKFNSQWDRFLGAAWEEAEARLVLERDARLGDVGI